MTRATVYIRNNGSFGVACGKTQDAGYHITEDSGKFTVWNSDERLVCKDVGRDEAEREIYKDWNRAH